jgi:hypothetical protein
MKTFTVTYRLGHSITYSYYNGECHFHECHAEIINLEACPFDKKYQYNFAESIGDKKMRTLTFNAEDKHRAIKKFKNYLHTLTNLPVFLHERWSGKDYSMFFYHCN